LKHTFKVEM